MAAAGVVALAGAVQADDWTAVRLRGTVLELVDTQWQAIQRGDVVPDSRVIRTLSNGRVEFQRGNETVELSGDTQIRIFDRATANPGRPFTTIKQDFGTVSVEADVEQVQHFAVQTPYVAAVVKGTKFTVTQGRHTASVSVERGHVAVEDVIAHQHTTIAVGQLATVAPLEHRVMEVDGSGVLPVVTDRRGRVLTETPQYDDAQLQNVIVDESTLIDSGRGKSADAPGHNKGSDDSGNGNSGHGNGGDGNNGKHNGDGNGNGRHGHGGGDSQGDEDD